MTIRAKNIRAVNIRVMNVHAVRRAGLVLLAAGLTLAAAPLMAQERPEAAAASALAGGYRLTNADGDRVCEMTLKPDALKDGSFALAFDKSACSQLILFSADITNWTPGPGDSIRLQGTQGRLVAEFTEGVGGTWEALREGDGVYFLVNPNLADPAEQAQPADLVGIWEAARVAGTTVCRLNLADTPTDDGAFRLELQPGCEAAITRFAPNRWRLERGDLVLTSAKGDRLRFARQEEGGWAKVPEGKSPLLLTRPAPAQ